MSKPKIIIIEIKGGIPEVVRQPKGTKVIIRDFDILDEEDEPRTRRPSAKTRPHKQQIIVK